MDYEQGIGLGEKWVTTKEPFWDEGVLDGLVDHW